MLALALACASLVAAAQSPVDDGDRAILHTAREVAVAAAAGHVEDLVERVEESGFGCMDFAVTRAIFRKELTTPGSWMHSYFFDQVGFQRRSGGDKSMVPLSEVLAQRGPLTFRVLRDERTGPKLQYRCVLIGSSGKNREAKLCFSRRGNAIGWNINMSNGPWCG